VEVFGEMAAVRDEDVEKAVWNCKKLRFFNICFTPHKDKLSVRTAYKERPVCFISGAPPSLEPSKIIRDRVQRDQEVA
jgi:arginine/ornithine N-succinyltransferase beta subunit